MNVKCLPLDYWMERTSMRDDCVKHADYLEIPPILSRPGRYLQGGFEWFETADGRAWECKKGYMAMELAWRDALEMNHRQVDALEGIVREKLATKKQRQLLYYRRDAEAIRDTRRQSHKWHLRYRREMT